MFGGEKMFKKIFIPTGLQFEVGSIIWSLKMCIFF